MSGIDFFGMLLIAAVVVFFVLFAVLMSNLNFQKFIWVIWSYKGHINRKTFWVSYVLMLLVISFSREVDPGISNGFLSGRICWCGLLSTYTDHLQKAT